MPKYVPCRKCGKKVEGKPILPKGYYYDFLTMGDSKYLGVKECQCHKDWVALYNLEKNYIKNGFDASYFDKEFHPENYNPPLTRIQSFLESDNEKVLGCLIYLYGSSNEKNVLAAHIGKSLIKKDKSCLRISMDTLAKLLQRSMKEEEEEARYEVERLRSCDFLIIDNAFLPRQASWGGYMLSFFTERMSQGKGLLFVSITAPSKIGAITQHGMEMQNFIEHNIFKRDTFFEVNPIEEDIPEVLF